MAVFASGVEAPEGPIALPDGAMYVAEMSPATACVTWLDPQGNPTVLCRTGGRPNGLALDGDGLIWVADAILRCVLCLAPDGRELFRIEGPTDDPFLFPNDLAFGPDGHLYLTDSGMICGDFLHGQSFVDGFMDLAWDGRVYEIDPRAKKVVRKIDHRLRFAKGIAFDAEDRLYANASFTGNVFRYDILGRSPPVRELFGNVLRDAPRPGEFRGPDGMKFGADGRLYCTVYGEGNVTVLDREGRVAERLACAGPSPTNCAFAAGGGTLLVTEVENGLVEAMDVPCAGLALHKPRLGVG